MAVSLERERSNEWDYRKERTTGCVIYDNNGRERRQNKPKVYAWIIMERGMLHDKV